MNNIKLKICGIVPGKTDENIREMADMLGFIFYDRSPRNIDQTMHQKIRNLKGIKKVGVFVDETPEKILSLVEKTGLNLVQLHGDESPEMCRSLKGSVEVIKTISILNMADLDTVDMYKGSVDYFLFDTRGDMKGGNGIKFNWNLLKDRRFGHPFFLSGGISRQDADIIKDYEHPELVGIDINSCFEVEPGQKDLGLVYAFKRDLYE